MYSILPAGGRRKEMLENYKEVRDLIGEMSASKDAASLIVDYIRQPLTY